MMQYGKLRGVIAEKGVKKKVLAKAFGISPQALGKKLSGETKITVDDAEKFCDVLQIESNEEKCEIFLSSPSQK